MDFHNIAFDFTIVLTAITIGALLTGLMRVPSIVGFIFAGIASVRVVFDSAFPAQSASVSILRLSKTDCNF